MGQYGPCDYTVQVTTGNFRTTMDKFDANKLNNGAVNTLGCAYYDNGPQPPLVANVNGVVTKYRYVRYNSTANSVAVQAAPAAVYWTDATMTTVTGKVSEALGAQGFPAGLLMPNSTDITGLTAALLNGNFVWIAVAGIVLAVASAAAAAGDQLFATLDMSTTGGLSKAAVGAATTGRQFGFALAASPSTVYVAVESI